MGRIPVIDLLAYICILIPAKRYGIVLIVGNQSDLLINDSFFHICTPANARNLFVGLDTLRQEYAAPEQCVGRDGCGYILRGFFVGDVDGPERDVMLLRGLLHLRHPVIGKGTLIGVVEDEAFSISFRVLSAVLEFRQCCIGVEREAHESDSTV